MSTEPEKLLPCPFCKKSTELIVCVGEDNRGPHVVCNFISGGCGATGGERLTEAEAIAAWNHRPSPSPDGWRPIEEAPRDGTSIVALVQNENGEDPAILAAQVKWETFENMMSETLSGWLNESEQMICTPIAFMPLPPPPGQAALQESK